MTGDTIGLKIATVSASAKMIAIIRKYSDSPMGKIKRSIQERDYVLLYPYTDRLGLKKILACYDELKEHGIEAEVYELDDEITTIGFLRNLNDTYDEISDEFDSENNEL